MSDHNVAESESIVRLRGVRKDYGAVKALKGLDLGIFENEVFGLLEPNGAGKATLVKLLLGLIHPTGGDVSVRV